MPKTVLATLPSLSFVGRRLEHKPKSNWNNRRLLTTISIAGESLYRNFNNVMNIIAYTLVENITTLCNMSSYTSKLVSDNRLTALVSSSPVARKI